MSFFLGFDLGGTDIKAGIYTETGAEAAASSRTVQLLSPQEGFAERDMEEIWQAVCFTARNALSRANLSGRDLCGISFSAHGKGLYAIDSRGKPVRAGINSSDTRSVQIVLKWLADGSAARAYPLSLQQTWTGHTASILAWMKAHERENYDNIASILMLHDYVRFRMTGEIGAEVTNIAGSNLYNNRSCSYDDRLLEIWGIEECKSKLAKILQSAEQCGCVRPAAAAELGVAAGTPVYAGFFDVLSSAYSNGVTDDTSLSATAGTWTIATAVHNRIVESPHPYVWSRYCIPGLYFVHEGSSTSAANFTWWRNNMVGQIPYDTCSRMVEEVQQRGYKNEPYFLPYLYGSNYQTGMNGHLCELQGWHEQKDVLYAIYEGIVFSHTLNLDKVMEITPAAKTIRMSGGPVNSLPWVRMYASIAGLPVEISPIRQPGCQAAAICAAVGFGSWRDFREALANCLKPKKIVEPDPGMHRFLRERYARFLKINESLAALVERPV